MAAWIVVAAADHAARGVAGGFVQAGHGKEAPLRRMRPGDAVFIYAPSRRFGLPEPLRAVVAHGRVRDSEPYRHDMGGGFAPWRRDVDWQPAREAPIAPLLDRLSFSAGRANWGMAMRRGLVGMTTADAALIASAMAPGAAHAATRP